MRIQHVTIGVPRDDLIPEVEAFYVALGGDLLARPPALDADTPGRWILFGDVQLHLVLGPPGGDPGHFAIEMGAAFDEAFERLGGLPGFRPARDLWGGRRCFIRDPAGNLVELFDTAPRCIPDGAPYPFPPDDSSTQRRR